MAHRNKLNRLILVLFISLIQTLCPVMARGLALQPSKPKNIIIMIGDGMGTAYTSAYRLYKDDPDTQEVEETVFNRLLVGSASTFPARESGYITDSAAAATALSSGIKTYNGAIGVDSQQQTVPTLLEKAKMAGLATGVAVTSQVNHATPAAFLSHNISRKNYDELANSYLTTDADVILGGGLAYFPQALRTQFEQKGYKVLTDMALLDTIHIETVKQPKILGLFADVQLPWAKDEPQANRLSKLTITSLELLSQSDKGFVLLVEGSLIDWAGHANDIATAMGEMEEFANAIEVVEQFVRQHPDTLMLVTADHSTGGLSIGANDLYAWQPLLLHKMKATPETIATKAINTENWQTFIELQLGFSPIKQEWLQLAEARSQGQEPLASALRKLVDIRTNTGWTTFGHTGEDVQVFAAGAAADLFNGHQDNTDIAHKLYSLLPQTK